ncbi:MAG: beta-glucanase/beta-glucan synthetase [Candidatus Carbobacillus altaicus]|nr:beta-glucanase/beta-glucan synthetase [Candidatus Carbobacillus altaicus]
MKKLWGYKLTLFLTIIAVLAAGCSPNNPNNGETNAPSEPTHNPFEANEQDTLILGSIAHGFANPQLDEKGRILPLQYNGGELKINYIVRASGKAKNVGFLVFVDGIPQPYKFNTTEAPYEYMHIFDLEGDDQDTPFTFVFTPITGKKGDTLHLSIASVYNPAFIPDMKETDSYGGYQTTLESGRSLIFTQDADALDSSSIPWQEVLSNVRLSTKPVTKELLERHSGFETVDMEALDKKVYSELHVDGAVRQDNYQVKKSGTLHVTFNLFGHPGMRYRNTFYLNHKALTSKDGTSFETTLSKGNVAVIDADIELENLEDFNTFYVVSVPLNADDFPDDVVVLEKTPSLLLYK